MRHPASLLIALFALEALASYPQASAKGSADVVMIRGRILTVDANDSIAQAIPSATA